MGYGDRKSWSCLYCAVCGLWNGWEGPGTGGDRAGGRKQETLDKSHLPWIMEKMEIIRVLSLYISEVLFWVKKNAGKFDWFFCSISGWHDLWQIIVVMVRNHILGYGLQTTFTPSLSVIKTKHHSGQWTWTQPWHHSLCRCRQRGGEKD